MTNEEFFVYELMKDATYNYDNFDFIACMRSLRDKYEWYIVDDREIARLFIKCLYEEMSNIHYCKKSIEFEKIPYYIKIIEWIKSHYNVRTIIKADLEFFIDTYC